MLLGALVPSEVISERGLEVGFAVAMGCWNFWPVRVFRFA